MNNKKWLAEQSKLSQQRRKEYEKMKSQLVPEVYASIALAMIRSDMTVSDVKYIFGLSQKIWDESLEKGINMLELCEQETGILLQEKV